jgi:hypothetical protein
MPAEILDSCSLKRCVPGLGAGLEDGISSIGKHMCVVPADQLFEYAHSVSV